MYHHVPLHLHGWSFSIWLAISPCWVISSSWHISLISVIPLYLGISHSSGYLTHLWGNTLLSSKWSILLHYTPYSLAYSSIMDYNHPFHPFWLNSCSGVSLSIWHHHPILIHLRSSYSSILAHLTHRVILQASHLVSSCHPSPILGPILSEIPDNHSFQHNISSSATLQPWYPPYSNLFEPYGSL